jgi:hypothetical protein
MAAPMMRQPARPLGRPKIFDPTKSVMAAPRIKPISTRVYGKGGTPYSSGSDMGANRGAGIGYGGFAGLPGDIKPYGT